MFRILAEFITVVVQNLIMAPFVCKIFKVKEPYERSVKIAFVQLILTYFVVNFLFSATAAQRIISGTIMYIIVGFWLFDGNRKKQILSAILQYFGTFAMDIIIQVLFFPYFMEVIGTLPPLEEKMIGRNLATAILFLIYISFEMVRRRKEGHLVFLISVLSFILGLLQLKILDMLARINPEGMLEHRVIVSILFSCIVIGGYLLVMEMFRQLLQQQQRKDELEQIALETKYQFDYYQKAYLQSERIRNLRHDMRNQLQTIEYMIKESDGQKRIVADGMLVQLQEQMRKKNAD